MRRNLQVKGFIKPCLPSTSSFVSNTFLNIDNDIIVLQFLHRLRLLTQHKVSSSLRPNSVQRTQSYKTQISKTNFNVLGWNCSRILGTKLVRNISKLLTISSDIGEIKEEIIKIGAENRKVALNKSSRSNARLQPSKKKTH